MTVAEKMAKAFVVDHTRTVKEVAELITTVAERGIEEGCTSSDCNCYHCSLFRGKIRKNRWWEAEA